MLSILEIKRIKIILHTELYLAAQLQQSVSHAVHGSLKTSLENLLQSHTADIDKPWIIERLALDIGELPQVNFEQEFIRRLLQALDEALRVLPHPLAQEVTQNTALLTPANRENHNVTAKLPSAAAPKRPAAPVNQRLTTPPLLQQALDWLAQFLTLGYWPAAPAEEGAVASPAHVNRPDATPERWLNRVLQDDQPEVLTQLFITLIPAAWQPQSRGRLAKSFRADTRQQLLHQLTQVQQWATPPVNLTLTPASLLLAIWHYRLHHPQCPLPVTPLALRPEEINCVLNQAEIRWLEALVAASVRSPGLLAIWLPWLRAAGQRQAAQWHEQLSPTTWQQLTCMDKLLPEYRQYAVQRPPQPEQLQPLAPGKTEATLPPALRVQNAGIVLLWPLLPRLFSDLGLTAKADEHAPLRFVSQQAQQQAACLLDVLAWNDEEGGEWRISLNKVLCGWPVTAELEEWVTAPPEQSERLEVRFFTLLPQIPGLQRCSAADIRTLFLQRPGTLTETRVGWQLTVDTHVSDILLQQLPWPLEQIIYPWLTAPLAVDWDIQRFLVPTL